MSENKIIKLLEWWQICQHSMQEEYDDDHIIILGIEKALLDGAGINMEDDWEETLKNRGLIQ